MDAAAKVYMRCGKLSGCKSTEKEPSFRVTAPLSLVHDSWASPNEP